METKFIKAIFLGTILGLVMYSCSNKPGGDATTSKGADSTAAAPDTTSNIKTDTMPVDKTRVKEDTATAATSKPKPLTIVIDNLGSETAPVEVSIYGEDNKFPSPKDQLKVFRFKPTGKKLTAQLDGIKYGKYAIAAYQDMDGDGKIATNMIGIPTDPYGFSRDYHPKVKAPAFKDCCFDYDQASNTITFSMIRKKD